MTVNGTGEPEDIEEALHYWRERCAKTASELSAAVKIIEDLTGNAVVPSGYTIPVDVVHRGLAWLREHRPAGGP
jgi:hypothetical protein